MIKFYSCFIESLLSLSVGFILTCNNRNKLLGIVRVCSKTADTFLSDLTDLYKERSVEKAKLILADPAQPLLDKVTLLSSRHRHQLPRFRTNRLKHSVIPLMIRDLNNVDGIWCWIYKTI
ncbi:hypothetical protein ATANTOWER_001180 [Ataeniobius toweri]|uniref:Uncharacterized protein n=1 Tax=Ataeniobius toweri TaxID=208326 RepID=A0ABU7BJ03_9TELE|nr:hypothetical protein [Ataeniobius toweri]